MPMKKPDLMRSAACVITVAAATLAAAVGLAQDEGSGASEAGAELPADGSRAADSNPEGAAQNPEPEPTGFFATPSNVIMQPFAVPGVPSPRALDCALVRMGDDGLEAGFLVYGPDDYSCSGSGRVEIRDDGTVVLLLRDEGETDCDVVLHIEAGHLTLEAGPECEHAAWCGAPASYDGVRLPRVSDPGGRSCGWLH